MNPVRSGCSFFCLRLQRPRLVPLLLVVFALSCFGQAPETGSVPVPATTEAQPPELVFVQAFPDLSAASSSPQTSVFAPVWPDLPEPPVNLPTLVVSRQLKKFDPQHDLDKIGSRGMGEGLNFFSRDFELGLGRGLANEVDSTSRLVQDPLINEYVNRVAQNIVSHSDAKLPLTVKVIDDSEINAFCLPGGFLYVNTGLLEQADSEAALAGIIAHEVGHVAARHAARNQSRGILMQIGLIAVAAALHGKNTAQTAVMIVGRAAIPLAYLHFSRGFEEEADLLALQYLYAAGYDPGAYVGFFEAMEKKRKSSTNFFVKLFSFHPPTPDRMRRCQRIVDGYFPDRSAYALTTSEFDDVKVRLSVLLGTKKVEEGKGEKEPVLLRPTTEPQPEPENAPPAKSDE